MFKRVFKLFHIARKFSSSGALATINEIYQLPTIINLFFNIISIGTKVQINKIITNPQVRNFVPLFKVWALTFIKLGQFLATRPDIIGEELAKSLENYSDKVP